MRKSITAPPVTPDVASKAPASPPAPSKLDLLATLLAREGGASLADMMDATGWQAHSVRGALAGALKKRGLAITSAKTEGVRRYAIGSAGE